MCLIPEPFGNRPKIFGSLSDELWKLISLQEGSGLLCPLKAEVVR